MSESPYKMKGMNFGTGQTHGTGNSPVKFWGALLKGGAALAKKGLAKAAGTTLLKEGVKGAAKQTMKKLAVGALKKQGGNLAKKVVTKAATDSYADHQEAKSKRGQVNQPKWGNSTL